MKQLLIAAFAVIFGTGMPQAAVIDVTSVTGMWGNVQGALTSGVSTNEIKWGAPATNAGQSGYRFTASSTPFTAVSSPFQLGVFTHNNFPIYVPSITGADLIVSVSGSIDGNAFTLGGVYGFTHFETPNGAAICAAGGSNPCPDLVIYTGAKSFFGDTLMVDGEAFVLNIDGFASGLAFLTSENASNNAALFASFTSEITAVPLPAGGLLLMGALAGLGYIRRKKA